MTATLSQSIRNTESRLCICGDITAFNSLGGEAIIDWVDSSGNRTPLKQEIITYESILRDKNGALFVTLSRGRYGTTEQSHSAGAIIEPLSNHFLFHFAGGISEKQISPLQTVLEGLL